jgi:hypothetical protein
VRCSDLVGRGSHAQSLQARLRHRAEPETPFRPVKYAPTDPVPGDAFPSPSLRNEANPATISREPSFLAIGDRCNQQDHSASRWRYSNKSCQSSISGRDSCCENAGVLWILRFGRYIVCAYRRTEAPEVNIGPAVVGVAEAIANLDRCRSQGQVARSRFSLSDIPCRFDEQSVLSGRELRGAGSCLRLRTQSADECEQRQARHQEASSYPMLSHA